MKHAIVWRDEHIAVRPLVLEDAPLLASWLSDPRVLEYYEGRDRPYDLGRVKTHFYRDDEAAKRRCLVGYDGTAIGYIQYALLDAAELEEYGYAADAWIAGMDLFIGEPEYWGRGIGTALVAGMAGRLLTEGPEAVTVDPHAENARALRCYAKAGFPRLRVLPRHELHEGTWHDCALIERRPAGA